jgi:hypothetical protein
MFDKLTIVQKSLLAIIIALIVYGVSATAAYSFFAARAPQAALITSVPTPTSEFEEDPNVPKTEPCPLDGELHTKQAKEEWEKRRPLAVMIENSVDARPQSGLSSADVVYEAVAEGGITRFMAIFLCSRKDVQVGPVRSARTYFVDWLSEYDALYAHVGGANTPGPANALGQIIDYDIKDLNQFSIGYPTFWRDYERLGRTVATEHTMYSTTHKLWAVGEKRGWIATDSAGLRWDNKFTPWKFKDDAPEGTVAKISLNFWEGYNDFLVEWSYDRACNCYHRNTGGSPHIDLNTKQQLSAKNVVVHFMVESHANDGYENNAHLLYADKGKGNALLFRDGTVVEGTWSKPTRLARERFLDKSGKEVVFNRGAIWIETVPEGSKVNY